MSEAIPEEVLHSFREGFDSEPRLVQVIRQYLRTPEQQDWLHAHDISIEDVLNGRITGGNPPEVVQMLTDWNDRLGFEAFIGGEAP